MSHLEVTVAMIEDDKLLPPTMEAGMGGVDDDSPPGSRIITPGADRGISEEKLPHSDGYQGPMMQPGLPAPTAPRERLRGQLQRAPAVEASIKESLRIGRETLAQVKPGKKER